MDISFIGWKGSYIPVRILYDCDCLSLLYFQTKELSMEELYLKGSKNKQVIQ